MRQGNIQPGQQACAPRKYIRKRGADPSRGQEL